MGDDSLAAPRTELGALARLSGPLVVLYVGNQLLGTVHTAVVGRIGAAEMGGVALGNAAFFTAAVAGMGAMLGLDPITAQALGAGDRDTARAALAQAPWLTLLTAVPLGLLVLAFPFVLDPLGMPQAVGAQTRLYLAVRVLNLFPLFLMTGMRAYLQSAGRTIPLLAGVVLANAINVPATWILVLGGPGLADIGLPIGHGLTAHGVTGAAWAGNLASVAQVAVLWLVVRADDDPRWRPRWDLIARVLRIGLPVGLQMSAEVAVFSIVSVFMGRFGEDALAGHQVALTLASFPFTATIGIGAAASVRVGHAIGRRDPAGTRRAGLTAIGAGSAFMCLSAATFLFFPAPLARLLTNQPNVIRAAVPLIGIAAVFQLSDGVQAIAAGAIRGTGRTRFPLLANLAGHYLIGLPLGIALSLGAGADAPGLWWGLTAGLTAVAIALTARFWVLSGRPLEPV